MKIQLTIGYSAGQVIDVPEMTANIMFDEGRAKPWSPGGKEKKKKQKRFFRKG